jgi:TRAP-type uncharacterized transport system substrate-binding protein
MTTKRWISLLVTVAVLCGASCVARAEDAAKQEPSAVTATATATAKVEVELGAGVVTKIDAAQQTFEIKSADNKVSVCAVDKETRFKKGDKDIAFTDLALGNYVRCACKKNAEGRAVAGVVFVSDAPPATETAPKAEEKK